MINTINLFKTVSLDAINKTTISDTKIFDDYFNYLKLLDDLSLVENIDSNTISIVQNYNTNYFNFYFDKFKFMINCNSIKLFLYAFTLIDGSLVVKFSQNHIYDELSACAFENRNIYTEYNYIMVRDCIYNYLYWLWHKIYELNNNVKEEFYLYDFSDSKFKKAQQESIDKFCFETNTLLPIKLMDNYYKEGSKHFNKIKHLMPPNEYL